MKRRQLTETARTTFRAASPSHRLMLYFTAAFFGQF